MTDRNRIRSEMRRQRRALDAAARAQAADDLLQVLLRQRQFFNAGHIACYFTADGEIDLEPVMHAIWARGKTLYLPVLNVPRRNRLMFAPYVAGAPLTPNRYGILEPTLATRRMASAHELDVVLTPLVAFDAGGNRLGMGGGFYDRTFAFLNHRAHWRKPRLLGVAYDFQRVEQLDRQPWDVPLAGIVTDRAFYSVQE